MKKIERFIYAKNVMNWIAHKDGSVYNSRGRKIGYKHPKGYIYSKIQIGKSIFTIPLHQYVFFFFNGEYDGSLDHIDGNKSNNEISNLRLVSQQKNMWNLKSAKGYSYNKSLNKFSAYICIDYKQKHLGHFETEEEARQAYLKAKKMLHKI